MKFKLIKKYPFCELELGTIVTDEHIKSDVVFTFQKSNDEYQVVPRKGIIDYPEFWEEVKEKEYTILSFAPVTRNVIVKLYENGLYGESKGEYKLEEMLNGHSSIQDGCLQIHSVRREKESGVIFTLGDFVSGYGEEGKIIGFELGENIMGGVYACFEKGKKISISLIKHSNKKKPILVTEDGKEIFENDIYYIVTESFNKHAGRAEPEDFLVAGNKRFSTEKAAQEYIKWNKPMYSLNDVKNSQGSFEMVSKIINALEKLDRK